MVSLTPELREELCAHLAQGAHVKTACEAVGISETTYYDWQARGKKARDEPPPTLDLTRQGLIDLLAEADVTYSARATKSVLLRLLTLHRQGPYLEFMEAVKRAGAVRTLESLARIEAGAQGGALVECVTTTRTAKTGVVTTTVRERFTPPDWRADGWFLERRHPTDWSRRWHGWPARSSRANLSRPARLPLVADQVSPAVTLAASLPLY